MFLWLAAGMGLIVFIGLIFVLSKITKRFHNTIAHCLAPVMSGCAVATVYLTVCMSRLLVSNEVLPILLCFTLFLLLGATISIWRQHKLHGAMASNQLWRHIRHRNTFAVVLVVAQWLLCVSVLFSFATYTQMNAALSLGLFFLHYLLGLFPLAIVLLAFVKARLPATAGPVMEPRLSL